MREPFQFCQTRRESEEYRKSALTPPGGVPPEDHKDDEKEVRKAQEGKYADN